MMLVYNISPVRALTHWTTTYLSSEFQLSSLGHHEESQCRWPGSPILNPVSVGPLVNYINRDKQFALE